MTKARLLAKLKDLGIVFLGMCLFFGGTSATAGACLTVAYYRWGWHQAADGPLLAGFGTILFVVSGSIFYILNLRSELIQCRRSYARLNRRYNDLAATDLLHQSQIADLRRQMTALQQHLLLDWYERRSPGEQRILPPWLGSSL